MIKSKDDLLRIEVVHKFSEAVFPAFDVAVFPLMESEIEHKDFMSALYLSQNERQILLLIPRGEKSVKLKQLSYLKIHKPWKYIDGISITYNKPSQSNGNCLIQMADFGFLYYKGIHSPDIGNSHFFRENYANASNHWDLGPIEGEDRTYTQYNRFSGELVYLLLKLAHPLQTGTVLWAMGGIDIAMLKFIKSERIQFQLYIKTLEEAGKILDQYEGLE